MLHLVSINSSLFNKSDRIVVLDSSFNPPHIAHKKQIENALNRDNGEQLSVLLLFSVNNADKASVDGEVLENRILLMKLFANDVAKSVPHPVPFAIATTDKARFIDKATVLRNEFNKPIEFLVGLDTIVRIMDQKYYDQPVSEVFEPLPYVSFLVLTREPDGESFKSSLSVKDKEQVGQITAQLPSSIKVDVIESDETTKDISSSKIRRLAAKGEPINQFCTDSVASFIIDKSLYRPKSS